MYDIQSKKFLVSHDVVFDEDTFPYVCGNKPGMHIDPYNWDTRENDALYQTKYDGGGTYILVHMCNWRNKAAH